MKLIVGLGNPGRQYVQTRHNVGYEVVEHLAFRLGWTRGSEDFDRKARSKFDGLAMEGLAELPGRSEKLVLLKPATFMNLSGRSVQAAVGFFQLPLSDLLVVLDDLALPAGKIRLRGEGSSGGHNGLKDIEKALGGSGYPRLRIGIDAPPAGSAGRDYVLERIPEAQRDLIDPAVARAARACMVWMENGIESAMNQFNAEEQKD